MERRGRHGWALGSAVLWSSQWWPFWLLAWWAARRRYPILDSKPKTNPS